MILGSVNHQQISYDQLSLTLSVQGFCKNILEEKSLSHQDAMVAYLEDLMEDATDFTWHGSVTWEDIDRSDRVRRVHAQKHLSNNKQLEEQHFKKFGHECLHV